MGKSFADKFAAALEEKQQTEPGYGLRTLARALAGGDPDKVETIRRRLIKYRPRPGGGAAEVKKPTDPARWEIEDAMGLERDALRPDDTTQALRRDTDDLFTQAVEQLRYAAEAKAEETTRRVLRAAGIAV